MGPNAKRLEDSLSLFDKEINVRDNDPSLTLRIYYVVTKSLSSYEILVDSGNNFYYR